ncbi:hypothetical protein [Microtetraspora sp. AC03309]|uniref:hypothetical protein n=1 Tax=Microtetraspora sp. AC03309 TaxID=2779376 RepID=UPI001E54AE21|nr:hypothetical protein [Microtetraspora sp. AC03309]
MTRRWPLLLLALPAFVATWSGWVGLGELTGFGPVKPLPGISDFTINTAITLPIGVETYAAYALGAWLSGRALSAGTRRFAKWSAIGSLVLGMLGQVAYHLLVTADLEVTPWQIVTAVSCLPVLVLGMGAALGHMLARDAHAVPATVGVTPTVEAAASLETPAEEGEESTPIPTPDAVPDAHGYTPEPTQVPVSREVYDWAAEQDLFDAEPPADTADTPESEPVLDDVPDGPGYVPEPLPDELVKQAASAFLADVVTGNVPGVRRIKTELGVGQEKAQQVRGVLTALANV